MAGYYIKGLLNTATAWSSYPVYGYTSTTDKRNFCAVRLTDPFYASLRESAYIQVYIYCKGTAENFKYIDNTNTEYDQEPDHASTSDPNIFRIMYHDVWSNLHGSEVTLNDFISNAPILDGVNLSDAERDALAIQYLNNVPESGQGVGTVTLQTKAPSQLLTFTSQKLGKSFKYWIRGNQTLELWKPTPQPVPDYEYELLFQTSWSPMTSMFISSDDSACVLTPLTSSQSGMYDINGALIGYETTSQIHGTVAKDSIKCAAIDTASTSTLSYVDYSVNDSIPRPSATYSWMYIAKKTLNAEIGWQWFNGSSSGEGAIRKADGSYPTGGQGDYFAISYQPGSYCPRVTSVVFSGTLKIYEGVWESGVTYHMNKQTYDGSTARTYDCEQNSFIMLIVMAIPSLTPEPVPDWELLVQAKYNPTGTMIVDSDLNGRYYYVDEENMTTSGRLLYEDLPMQSYFKTVYAKSSIVATEGNISQSTSRSGSFAKDAAISTYTDYTRAIIAKKNANVTLPLEIAFYWNTNQGVEGGILKQNGTFDGWHAPTSGDVFYVNENGINNWYRFDGKIKAYIASYGTDNSGSWYEYDAQNINNIRGSFIIAIAIPN